MANVNNSAIAKTVVNLVKNLSVRNKDIISRRFGLKSGKKETLESIGKGYGVTRERVRQIEEFSLAQLVKAARGDQEVAKYTSLAKEILAQQGGAMKEAELFKAFSGSDKSNVLNASLVFILSLTDEPVRVSENDSLYSFWALSTQQAASFKDAVSTLVQALDRNKGLVPQNEFLGFAQKNFTANLTEAGDTVSDKQLESFLAISKELGRNVFDEVGLVKWSEVEPKGVRDKAYLVLKKESQPKHFTEITRLINATGFSARKANVQTVHNELIKDQRFVLVGRGLYGLSAWGYKAGTVKEVLVDILNGSSKPVSKAQLVAKVLDARVVKENTILLNLQDSKVFSKQKDGTYALRKA